MYGVIVTPRRVIIYSHANAIDIGFCAMTMEPLGDTLDTDYIYYDYEGYGCSGGAPHSYNLPRDLRAVYNYARTLYKGSAIYLAGESSAPLSAALPLVGSVPTCAVAHQLYEEYARDKEKGLNPEVPLAGIIIHAGLYSAASFPCGCLIRHKDPYNNAEMLKGVAVRPAGGCDG